MTKKKSKTQVIRKLPQRISEDQLKEPSFMAEHEANLMAMYVAKLPMLKKIVITKAGLEVTTPLVRKSRWEVYLVETEQDMRQLVLHAQELEKAYLSVSLPIPENHPEGEYKKRRMIDRKSYPATIRADRLTNWNYSDHDDIPYDSDVLKDNPSALEYAHECVQTIYGQVRTFILPSQTWGLKKGELSWHSITRLDKPMMLSELFAFTEGWNRNYPELKLDGSYIHNTTQPLFVGAPIVSPKTDKRIKHINRLVLLGPKGGKVNTKNMKVISSTVKSRDNLSIEQASPEETALLWSVYRALEEQGKVKNARLEEGKADIDCPYEEKHGPEVRPNKDNNSSTLMGLDGTKPAYSCFRSGCKAHLKRDVKYQDVIDNVIKDGAQLPAVASGVKKAMTSEFADVPLAKVNVKSLAKTYFNTINGERDDPENIKSVLKFTADQLLDTSDTAKLLNQFSMMCGVNKVKLTAQFKKTYQPQPSNEELSDEETKQLAADAFCDYMKAEGRPFKTCGNETRQYSLALGTWLLVDETNIRFTREITKFISGQTTGTRYMKNASIQMIKADILPRIQFHNIEQPTGDLIKQDYTSWRELLVNDTRCHLLGNWELVLEYGDKANRKWSISKRDGDTPNISCWTIDPECITDNQLRDKINSAQLPENFRKAYTPMLTDMAIQSLPPYLKSKNQEDSIAWLRRRRRKSGPISKNKSVKRKVSRVGARYENIRKNIETPEVYQRLRQQEIDKLVTRGLDRLVWMLAYSAIDMPNLAKIVFNLVGEGEAGKSSFLTILKAINPLGHDSLTVPVWTEEKDHGKVDADYRIIDEYAELILILTLAAKMKSQSSGISDASWREMYGKAADIIQKYVLIFAGNGSLIIKDEDGVLANRIVMLGWLFADNRLNIPKGTFPEFIQTFKDDLSLYMLKVFEREWHRDEFQSIRQRIFKLEDEHYAETVAGQDRFFQFMETRCNIQPDLQIPRLEFLQALKDFDNTGDWTTEKIIKRFQRHYDKDIEWEGPSGGRLRSSGIDVYQGIGRKNDYSSFQIVHDIPKLTPNQDVHRWETWTTDTEVFVTEEAMKMTAQSEFQSI